MDKTVKMDFSALIVSLGSQVMMALGQIPHPETKQKVKNLDMARQTIDLIAVLEEKTKGNLTSDEDKLMKEVLSSVRLSYVNLSK